MPKYQQESRKNEYFQMMSGEFTLHDDFRNDEIKPPSRLFEAVALDEGI